MADKYVLTRRGETVLRVHLNPGETCNTDDDAEKQVVDSATAQAMLADDPDLACNHCHPEAL